MAFIVAYHFVDGFYDRQHLLVADLAIAVDIVQLERPVEFVLHFASARDAQCTDEFLEVNCA